MFVVEQFQFLLKKFTMKILRNLRLSEHAPYAYN